MENVAFIEFNPYHSDCIYSQVLYLKNAGYGVHLICHEKLGDLVSDIKIADKLLLESMSLGSLLRIRRYLLRNNINTVVVNTAQGSAPMKFFMLPFPKRMRFFGTIHDLRKLTHSSGQKRIMKKLKGCIVLADFLKDNFPWKTYPSSLGYRCQSMTPLQLPDYPRLGIEKPENEVWIAVAGALDNGRRDYDALLENLPAGGYANNVRFLLLGNCNKYDGPHIVEAIKEKGLEKSFMLFDHFLPNDEFYSYLRVSDYIMLLVHEKSSGFEGYLNSKITGSMIISYALRKPMLCDKAFQPIRDYAPHGIFYDRDRLAATVNELKIPVTEDFYDAGFEQRFSVEAQTEQYANFIKGE